jgi:hypothetical protein
MDAKRAATAAAFVGLIVIGSVMYSRIGRSEINAAGFNFTDPLVAKAWTDCSGAAALPSKLKAVGNYVGFPLDIGSRLVLAKEEQLNIYQNSEPLSEADRLNGYIWKGVVALVIEGAVQTYGAEDGQPMRTASWKWMDSKDIFPVVKCSVQLKKNGADETDVTFSQLENVRDTARFVFKDADHVPFLGWK